MKKILAFSSIRSDYDLLSGLYQKLRDDSEIDFKIIVSGAHLSPKYGYSYRAIEQDRIEVLAKLETLIDSDLESSRVKSASLLLQNSIDIIRDFSPDLILYAGDREDVLVCAMIAAYLSIPSIHFFGGDHVTDGYIDNPIRHAASKLSTAHMVTIEEHKLRLIHMGEREDRIFVTGNPALDRFKEHYILNQSDEAQYKNILERVNKNFAIFIYHPSVDSIETDKENVNNIFKALDDEGVGAIINYPNSDPGNSSIIDIIEKNVSGNSRFIITRNLSRKLFINLYHKAKLIIGNSSSGILEAASIPIPAINVGKRQCDRYAEENVIFCDSDYKNIRKSLSKALSDDFSKSIRNIRNPYGDGDSSEKAYQIIKKTDFSDLLKKTEDPLKVVK